MVATRGRAYIIGAGIAGLSTGRRLQELGVDVVIFEKSPEVGGMGRSFAWLGFKNLDLGPHVYHTPEEKLVAEWQREFGDLLHENKFWAKNVKGVKFDKLYDYPLSLDVINNFPPELREKILTELKERDPSKLSKAASYYDYVLQLVGPTLLEMFFIRYTEKIWGMSVHEMTANWAPKRINLTKESSPFHSPQWSAVGKYGSGAIMNRLSDKFRTAGGQIVLNKEVTGVEYQGKLITALVLDNHERVMVDPQDVVISTMPINLLAKHLGIQNSLRFRGVRLIFVSVDKMMVLPGNTSLFYYDAPEIIFHRINEPKKCCPVGFPEDKTVLTIEVSYAEDDKKILSDDSLINRVLNDLKRVGLLESVEQASGACVVSLPYAYPFLSKEYEPEFARVLHRLNSFKQLYLAGVGGEYHYADLQILYTKGKDLAERLAAAMAGHSESKELMKNKVITQFNPSVSLGGKLVGGGQEVFVIAEIGLNHNGSVEVAKELIDEAVAAGCSAVKFQTYKTASRISKKIKANKYAEELVDLEDSLFAMLEKCEFTAEDFVEVFRYAKEKGIVCFAAPFDLESLALLEELDCPFYKVASMDVINLPLVEAVAKTGKPIIMSSGMSTLGQLEEAVNIVKEAGNPNLILLHCVSSYPADPVAMNLNVIDTLRKAFRVPVGFSDHTIGLTCATLSCAVGASLIERHFTLNRFMEGPDHIFSSDPKEMKELVGLVGMIPQALGTGEKAILESEIGTIDKFKKGIYAKRDIKRGEVISLDKIAIKGPAGGILPKYLNIVLGRVSKVDVEADFPITWDII